MFSFCFTVTSNFSSSQNRAFNSNRWSPEFHSSLIGHSNVLSLNFCVWIFTKRKIVEENSKVQIPNGPSMTFLSPVISEKIFHKELICIGWTWGSLTSHVSLHCQWKLISMFADVCVWTHPSFWEARSDSGRKTAGFPVLTLRTFGSVTLRRGAGRTVVETWTKFSPVFFPVLCLRVFVGGGSEIRARPAVVFSLPSDRNPWCSRRLFPLEALLTHGKAAVHKGRYCPVDTVTA